MVQDFFFLSLFHSAVCSFYRRDQDVCKVILNNLLPMAVSLGQSSAHAEETGDAQGQFLTIIGAFWYVLSI